MGKAPRKAPGAETPPFSATPEQLAELADAMTRAPIIEDATAGITLPDTDLTLGGTIPEAIRYVEILGVDDDRDVQPGSLIVVCREPGFRRAGIAHPALEVYPADRFSRTEMAAMEAAPELALILVR